MKEKHKDLIHLKVFTLKLVKENNIQIEDIKISLKVTQISVTSPNKRMNVLNYITWAHTLT